jgi:hypothetical protein
MIVSRRAESLSSWTVVERDGDVWIYQKSTPFGPALCSVSAPTLPARAVDPYELLDVVLPDPAPLDEASAIMNLAKAGFTVEMTKENSS